MAHSAFFDYYFITINNIKMIIPLCKPNIMILGPYGIVLFVTNQKFAMLTYFGIHFDICVRKYEYVGGKK